MTSHHSAVLPGAAPDRGQSTVTNLTFISIHDLSPDARILYSSESIIDVLGYTPDEVVNRSLWEFFPEEEVPYAKSYHKRGVEKDRAAMLAYCRVRDSQGQWVGCECCFTVVYDVIVVCTSIYRSGMPSEKRALEAPVIRRLFSSSPLDPRYHMLSHISQKFKAPSKAGPHEPRAALFLNRFTRTLTIMYATSGIQEILGIPSSALQGRSFYYCIAENCLADAVRCLENAKGNDSIAYMRFWYRDPRPSDPGQSDFTSGDESDEDMTTNSSVDQDMGGGVHLSEEPSSAEESTRSTAPLSDSSMDLDQSDENREQSRTSSGDSMNQADTHGGIFGTSRPSESSASSAAMSPEHQTQTASGAIELEAVISCASDGLVVCLRRARPVVPDTTALRPCSAYRNGLFAAPWADQPIIPPITERPAFGLTAPFAPSLGPQGARQHIKEDVRSKEDFMTSIRDQAVFAWALTAINGTLSGFASGVPLGESISADGVPIWESDDTPMIDSRNQSTGEGNFATASTSSASASASTSLDQRKHFIDHDAKPAAIGNDHRKLFGDPGIKQRQGLQKDGSE